MREPPNTARKARVQRPGGSGIGLEEFFHLPLRFFFRKTVALFQATRKFLHAAASDCKIVIRQLAPLFLGSPLDLIPFAVDLLLGVRRSLVSGLTGVFQRTIGQVLAAASRLLDGAIGFLAQFLCAVVGTRKESNSSNGRNPCLPLHWVMSLV
jgi:hypothetical protein